MAPDEVHVIHAGLDVAAPALARLERLLPREERERARRFSAERDRWRFVVAHAALRALLGRCLGKAPWDLKFRTGRHGKPALAGDESVRFNLSHAANGALVAIARDREVGVDLEDVRAELEFHAIAREVFTSAERAELAALAPTEVGCRFYALWVRKEAYLKGTGEGLSDAARHVTVARDPEWTLHDLVLDPRRAAALAVQGVRPFRLRCWSVDASAEVGL